MSKLSIGRQPVAWQPPGDCDPVTFYLRRSTPDEIATFRELGETKDDDPEQTAATTFGLIASHVIAWEGVDGEDGEPAECTHEAVLGLLLDYPDVVARLTSVIGTRNAFSNAVNRKNGSGGGCSSDEPTPQSVVATTEGQTDLSGDAPT